MKRILTGIAVALALCAISGRVAKADSFTAGPVQLTGFLVGSTTAELEIQCLVPATCGTWYLGDVTLKGFTFSGSPTLGTVPAGSGYTVQNGGQNNAAVGSGGGCNDTQPGMAVCWDDHSVPLTFQLGSGVNVFTANIIGGSWTLGSLHVQATAYDNTSGSQQGGGKVFAISDNLLVVEAPEPSSLGLLATGLISLVFVSLRRLRFNN